MNTPIKKDGKIDESLANSIKNKLAENQGVENDEENDEEKLIQENPLASIANSLFFMERIMKANLYVNLCNVNGQTFRQSVFNEILGGDDHELAESKEIERLRKLNEQEKKDGKTDLSNPNNE